MSENSDSDVRGEITIDDLVLTPSPDGEWTLTEDLQRMEAARYLLNMIESIEHYIGAAASEGKLGKNDRGDEAMIDLLTCFYMNFEKKVSTKAKSYNEIAQDTRELYNDLIQAATADINN